MALSSESKAAIAVAVMFFVNGAVFASWASRIPAIQKALSLNAESLGLAMFALGAGALLSMPLAGKMAGKFGSASLTFAFLILFCLSLAVIPAATNVWQLSMVLGAFGFCGSAMDVAMNVHAVAIQVRLGKPVLSRLHALWSVGGMIGSACGALMARCQISPEIHFLFVAIFLLIFGAFARGRLLDRATELRQRGGPAESPKNGSETLLSWAIMLWCAICFFGFMCEGAIADWSALYLQNSLGTAASFAALGYCSYSAAMATGRFAGDHLITVLGRNNLLRYGNLLNSVVVAIVLWLKSPVLAVLGFGIFGFGMCTLAPIALSSASYLNPRRAATTIALVSIAGYCGILLGPPLLGFAAQMFGFSAPVVAVSILSLLLFVLAALTDYVGTGSDTSPGAKLEQPSELPI